MGRICTHTAILYFTTGEKQTTKALANSTPASARVQKVLYRHTLSQIQQTALPFFISDGTAHGSSFSQRLEGALAQVFSQGYQNVLVVGDDCPALTWRHLNKAVCLVQAGQVVLGPSHDGGIYLLGLTIEHFQAGLAKTDQLR